jgi:ribosomal subunit interface protein
MNSPTDHSRIVMPGVRLELTPDLHDALRARFESVLSHEPEIIRISVRLHKNPRPGASYRFRATAEVECHGPNLVAGTEGMEVFPTLNELAQKLDDHLLRCRAGAASVVGPGTNENARPMAEHALNAHAL